MATKQTIASLFLAAGASLASPSSANDNTIFIDNPDAMYGSTKNRPVNCNTLDIRNNNQGKKTAYLTCDFALQVDGQVICSDESSIKEPGDVEENSILKDDAKGLPPSFELIDARRIGTITQHQEVAHQACLGPALKLELATIKEKKVDAFKIERLSVYNAVLKEEIQAYIDFINFSIERHNRDLGIDRTPQAIKPVDLLPNDIEEMLPSRNTENPRDSIKSLDENLQNMTREDLTKLQEYKVFNKISQHLTENRPDVMKVLSTFRDHCAMNTALQMCRAELGL